MTWHMYGTRCGPPQSATMLPFPVCGLQMWSLFKTHDAPCTGQDVCLSDPVFAPTDLLYCSYPTPGLLCLSFAVNLSFFPFHPSLSVTLLVNPLLSRSHRACPRLVHSIRRFDELYDAGDFACRIAEIFLCTTTLTICIVGDQYGTEICPLFPSLLLVLRSWLSANGRNSQQLCLGNA